MGAALLGALPARASAGPRAVRLAAAGPGEVRFSVDVPEPALAALDGVPEYTGLSLEGYETGTVPGEPALPARVVTVAIPPTGEVRVSGAGVSATVREGVLLAPVLSIPRGAEDAPPSFPGADRAYSHAGPVSTGRVVLKGIAWLRNQRVAKIEIWPADYDPAARRLTVYRRIDVDVAVETVAPTRTPAERIDPFEAVYRTALVNYEQGRAWRRPAPERAGGLGTGGGIAEPMHAEIETTSVYAGRTWIKIAVRRTGFYRVEFSQVRNFSIFNGDTTIANDSLRLFTWVQRPGQAGQPDTLGAPVLPEFSYCDACDYREVAIAFVDFGVQGKFGNNRDYFYFFAMGPSDWADLYDPLAGDSLFVNNPYDDRNFYYLTVANSSLPMGGTPKRIATTSGTVVDDGTEIHPTTFDARLHYEEDHEYWPDAYPQYPVFTTYGWEKFFWRTITNGSGNSFSTPIEAPSVDSTTASRARIRIWGLSSNSFRSIPDHILDVSLGPMVFPRRSWNDQTGQTFDAIFTGLHSANTLGMLISNQTDPSNSSRLDRVGLAWVDLFYHRFFQPLGDTLEFSSPGPGNYIYQIGPFRSPTVPRVFDVTNPLDPTEIVNLGTQYVSIDAIAPADSFQLSFETVETQRRRYRIFEDPIARVASEDVFEAPFTSLRNLRSQTMRADYMVIFYDQFAAAAESLSAWRKYRLPLEGETPQFETLTIPISALYDQFSGGRTDPSAIRNFLRAAYFNWDTSRAGRPGRRLSFVTLLGDASYDFKNITQRAGPGQPGSPLPSYEGGFDPIVGRQFATDDWLLNVDNAAIVLPDFYGGRIPVNDATTALEIVRDKVLAYERGEAFGEWRNRVMLIADDNIQGNSCDPIGWGHIFQTSELDTASNAQGRRHLPAHVDRAYVYLHTYPDGPGATKPAARADIFRNIADGVVMMNYIGHGSPFKIADESVLLVGDAATLSNASKLTVFVAASCDVGKYNDPNVQSLGERLLATPGGGCVAVVSATELAFSNQNAELNAILYDEIFDRGTLRVREGSATTDSLIGLGEFHVPISGALLAAKQGGLNNQKYQVMGDAATRLDLPQLWVEMSLTDESGTAVDSVNRGHTLVVHGRVLDQPGGTLVPYDGVAKLLIEDSAPLVQTPVTPCQNFFLPSYRFRAGPIFRGDVSVSGGQFTARFVTPLDAAGGAYGRVRAYLEGRRAGDGYDVDGTGSLTTQVSPGVPPPGDNSGPRLTLSFAGGSTSVRPDATLQVDLFDPSGILITSHNQQNGIIVTVDGNTTSRADITPSFRYAADSYQAGRASYQLPNLSPGSHHVQVSAADNLALGLSAGQHRSTAALDFDVVTIPPLRIARTYLFPNPVCSHCPRAGGQFVVDAPGDSINALLRIYTISGRLIKTLTAFGGIGQVQLEWDGLDDEYQPLANGTYLYKVHVNGRDSDGKSNPRQRADAEGRIVVINR